MQVTITGGAGFDAADIQVVTVDGVPVPGFVLGTPFTVSLLGSATSASVVVNVAGDATNEADETFTLTLSAPTGGYALATAAATDTITNDDAPLPTVTNQIGELQGSAHLSPFVTAVNTASSSTPTVEGIITARSTNGFYLQDDTPDANRLTSDAIFVFTGITPDAGLTIGERVRVTAKVFEQQSFNNLPFTQLVSQTTTGASAVAVALQDIFQFNDVNTLPFERIGGTGGRTPALASTNSDDFNGGLANAFNVDASGNPVDGTDFWESLEGMRVVLSDPVVADGFWYSFNGFYAYSETAGSTEINSRGGLTISGGPGYDPAVGVAGGGRTVMDGDQNPERIQLDFSNTALSTGGFGTLNTQIDMGDKLNDVTGIVRLDFTNWKLFVTDTPTFRPGGNQPTGPTPETTTLTADGRQLKTATYNVENLTLFTNNTRSQANFDTGIVKFNNIARMLKENAGSPDVILINEMQDNNGATNDGTTDASINWTALTQALRNQTGKDYVWVDEAPVDNAEGGAPGANIRVGIIYDKSKVSLGGPGFADPAWTGYDGVTAADLLTAAAANLTAADSRRVWTDRVGDGQRTAGDLIAISDNLTGEPITASDWTATRLSILGQFDFNGQQLFLSANHWPSKGGSGLPYFYNPADITADGLNGRWLERKNIAQDMWSLVEYGRTTTPEAKFIIGGDLNEYWFFDPVRVLQGTIDASGATRAPGLATLVNMNSTETVAERFGYNFDGNSQTLDHLLVSSILASSTQYDALHVNTGYNSVRTDPANRIYNLSDHDPSLIVTDFRAFSERLAGRPRRIRSMVPVATTRSTAARGPTCWRAAGERSADRRRWADMLNGGGGFDFVRYDASAAGIQVDIFYPNGIGGDAAGDQFISIEGVSATDADDGVWGGSDQDVIYTWWGDDYIDGRGGDDWLLAGGGNDTVRGSDGADYLFGGVGSDMFAFALLDLAAGVRDVIWDFEDGSDAIRLQGLTPGSFGQGEFGGDVLLWVLLSGGGYGEVLVKNTTLTALQDQIFFS